VRSATIWVACGLQRIKGVSGDEPKEHDMGDHRVQNVKGKAKEAAGDVVGNDELAEKGQQDQDKAKVKEKAGDLKNKLTDDD
jgi:uncharacterized protein YjbJ (UPF0337 family)